MLSLAPVPGSTEMYEIFHSGQVLGIVWRRGDAWLADPFSMSQSLVCGIDRDAVAQELVKKVEPAQKTAHFST